MAEGSEDASAGSWWGSWINSAKTKTSTVFEAVKKDLGEISSAVRTEASNVGAAIESTLKFDEEDSAVGTVKKSLSTFFGQVTEALIPSIEDDEVEAMLITRDGIVTLSGFPKHLAELQTNDKTYTVEPDKELAEKYKRWMEVVEQDQFTQTRLAKHLAGSEILNEKYLSLVPDKVPHMDFWQRYLFKRALLEDALANAEKVEMRAKTEVNSNKPTSPRKNIIQTEQPKLACNTSELADETAEDVANNKSIDKEIIEDDINWEVEEIPNNVELSEEEQTRLLEQYEQEIQEREKRKSIVLTDDAENVVKEKPTPSPVKKSTDKAPTKPASKLQPKSADSKPQPKSADSKPQPKSADSKPQPKSADSKRTANNANTNNKPNAKQAQNQKDATSKANRSQQKNKGVLQLQKDHFKKDESSSNSDESWEKDFDLNE